MNIAAREQWQAALPEEVEFWRQIISGKFPNQEWVDEMRRRVAGDYPFPGHLAAHLPDRACRILDVGSGPATTIGPVGAPPHIEIIAIDPLGDAYGKLLQEAGLTPHLRTLQGEGERLSELGLGLFDLVHSRNALDHAYDPIRVIREMLAVCKPDGVVWLEGSVNESVKQNGDGLHQWNFMPLDNGDLVVWQPDNQATSLQSALGDSVHVKASGHDWYKVEIRRA
jgi:SAM-dependent methyltransferase